jgi:MYXO-CTERM domain-containing protein
MDANVSAVPEPATFALAGMGVLTLLGVVRRRCS